MNEAWSIGEMLLMEEAGVLGETPVSESLCAPQSHTDWPRIKPRSKQLQASDVSSLHHILRF
jgi:hypothetical protein